MSELKQTKWVSVHAWNPASDQPPGKGVYWVQSRDELAHLRVRYHSAYWNGWKWYVEPGSAVYHWQYITQAPEPKGARYYDELGRLDIVPAQERGVELSTEIAKPSA